MLILIGCPGSGKTTFVNHFFEKVGDFYLVSRDSFRFSLYNLEHTGRDFIPEMEDLIRDLERISIHRLCEKGKNIIIDDAFPDLDFCMSVAQEFGYDVLFVNMMLETSMYVAIQRNEKRERSVPPYVFTRWKRWFEKNKEKIYPALPPQVFLKISSKSSVI